MRQYRRPSPSMHGSNSARQSGLLVTRVLFRAAFMGRANDLRPFAACLAFQYAALGQILRRCRQRFMVKAFSSHAGFAAEYLLIKGEAVVCQIVGRHFLPPARIFSSSIVSRSISRDASRLKKWSPQIFSQSQHRPRHQRNCLNWLIALFFIFGMTAPLFNGGDQGFYVLNTPRGRVGRELYRLGKTPAFTPGPPRRLRHGKNRQNLREPEELLRLILYLSLHCVASKKGRLANDAKLSELQ